MLLALGKTLLIISIAAEGLNDIFICANTVGCRFTSSPNLVQRKKALSSHLLEDEGPQETPEEQHSRGGAALTGQKHVVSDRHRWKEQAGGDNPNAANSTSKRGIASTFASLPPSSPPITTETPRTLEWVGKRAFDVGVHLLDGQSPAADIEEPQDTHFDSSKPRIEDSSGQQAGNESQANAQSTLLNMARQTQDLDFGSLPFPTSVAGEDELSAATASISPGTPLAASSEARLEKQLFGNASGNGAIRPPSGGRFWSLIASRTQLIIQDRLQRARGHVVPIVLALLGLPLIVACGYGFVFMHLHMHEETRPKLSSSEMHEVHSAGYYTPTPASIHSSPGTTERSERVASAPALRAQGRQFSTDLCAELVVPDASECHLIVPRLSARVLEEHEAMLSIENTTGNPLFSISLSEPKRRLNISGISQNPLRGHRLTFCSISGEFIFGSCEVTLGSPHGSTEKEQRGIASIWDKAERHFADLVQISESGKEDRFSVVTRHGWTFTWRRGCPTTAVDSDGRLIAAAFPRDTSETLRTVTVSSGADVCLIVLSLLSMDVLEDIGRS